MRVATGLGSPFLSSVHILRDDIASSTGHESLGKAPSLLILCLKGHSSYTYTEFLKSERIEHEYFGDLHFFEVRFSRATNTSISTYTKTVAAAANELMTGTPPPDLVSLPRRLWKRRRMGS